MPRFILTGPPGAGKTTLINVLATQGFPVVREAATDLIADWNAQGIEEPWTRPGFIGAIADMQSARWRSAPLVGPCFHDRSAVCTLALARHLGIDPPAALLAQIADLKAESLDPVQVFFIANLGFVEHTAARRISFEDSLIFEALHRETYAGEGFTLVDVPAAPVEERLKIILRHAPLQ